MKIEENIVGLPTWYVKFKLKLIEGHQLNLC